MLVKIDILNDINNYFVCEDDNYIIGACGISNLKHKNDYVCINLSFYEMGKYDKNLSDEKYHKITFMTFNCYFKDCYNNWYYQTLQVSSMYNLKKDIPIKERTLNVSANNTEILSPPIEIDERDLPWENGKSLCHH